MSMRRTAISDSFGTAAGAGCGCGGVGSSMTLWWRGNWRRLDRRLFRTPLPASGNSDG